MTRRGHGTELLDVWQAGQVDDDGLKRLVEHTVQQVLQAETTAFLEAEPHERTAARRGHRNGVTEWTLTTRVRRLRL